MAMMGPPVHSRAVFIYAESHGGAVMADLTKKLKTFWFDFRTDLPQSISVGIGQAAAEWAVLEREIEEIIRILTNGETEQTRILTNRMNVRLRAATIKALIESHILHGTLRKIHRRHFLRMSNLIEPTQTRRDVLAHGLWTKRGKSWYVLQFRQARPIPELKPKLDSLSRAVLPQSHKITRAGLRSTCRRIVALAKKLERFGRRLERELGPLQHKPPRYTRRRHDYRPEPKNKAP
jgi:hypothetical protein